MHPGQHAHWTSTWEAVIIMPALPDKCTYGPGKAILKQSWSKSIIETMCTTDGWDSANDLRRTAPSLPSYSKESILTGTTG